MEVFEEFGELNFESLDDLIQQQQPQESAVQSHVFDLKKSVEQQQQQVAPMPVAPKQQQQPLLVFLKPAKSRDDQYEGGNFPSTMLCTPYKYDLKIVGELEAYEQNSLALELVDAESNHKPEGSPSETRQGVIVEAVESYNPREKIVRFALNWCSFHFRKRAFRLKVTFKKLPIFVSSPFHTYARRRDTPYSVSGNSGSSSNSSSSASSSMMSKRQGRHAPLVSQVQQHLLAQSQAAAAAAAAQMYPVAMTPSWRLSPQPMYAAAAPVQSQQAKAVPAVQTRIVSPHQVNMHSHVLNQYHHNVDSFQQIPPTAVYSPLGVQVNVSPVSSPILIQQQQVPQQQQQVIAPKPQAQQGAQNINNLLVSLERTTMAIQLISSLSPMEREAVSNYLTSNNLNSH